ncbi:MAG: LacI family DNA-binding transcriptional regulator [Eubacterium sp.]
MKKAISISELAKRLDLSTTTVSRALSGKGRVGEATRAKIVRYISDNDLEPKVHKGKWTDKKTKNICVTLPAEGDFANMSYFQQILMSIYDYFIVRGYNIIIAKTSANDYSALLKLVKSHKIDGVILTRTMENSSVVRFLKEKGVPFVAAGSYPDSEVYQVDVDNENASYQMTSILLKTGMKRIALFCGNKTHIVTQSRMKGYIQAYQDMDFDYDKKLVVEHTGYAAVADKVIEDLLEQGIDCILCMDDNICQNVLNKLRQDNVKVPHEIKVATLYDSPILKNSIPQISCISFDIAQMGAKAAEVLFTLLNQNKADKKTMLGFNLILKESTGISQVKPAEEYIVK